MIQPNFVSNSTTSLLLHVTTLMFFHTNESQLQTQTEKHWLAVEIWPTNKIIGTSTMSSFCCNAQRMYRLLCVTFNGVRGTRQQRLSWHVVCLSCLSVSMLVCVSECMNAGAGGQETTWLGFLLKVMQLYIYSEGEPVGFGVGAAHSSNNTDHSEESANRIIPGGNQPHSSMSAAQKQTTLQILKASLQHGKDPQRKC